MLRGGRCVRRAPVLRAPMWRRKVDEMVRVDQAGEVAAVRITAHQLFWMSPLSDAAPVAREILRDELEHRRVMDELARKHDVRTTALDPLFRVGAFVLGTGTALLGKEAMMCCHAAVEVVIYNHYNDQLRAMTALEQARNADEASTSDAAPASALPPLREDEARAWDELKSLIVALRDEELHHQHLGEDNGAADAPAYPLLYHGIRYACKLGVALAERL